MANQKQKILVLSSWFPYPQNPILGCFVAEQVKALITYESLDVRVICFTPFWMRYRNCFPFSGRNKTYHKSLVSSTYWDHWDEIKVMYVPYRVGGWIKRPLQFYSAYTALLKINKFILDEFKFDLIHAHTSYIDGRLGVYLSMKYQVPLIITEHTSPFSLLTKDPLTKYHTSKAINFADRVICVSHYLAKQINESIKYDINKVNVIPNGYNEDIFYPGLNDSSDCINLLFVGALIEYKNPFLLLKAFQRVKTKILNLSLRIVGSGDLYEDIEKFIQKNNLKDCVQLLGAQTREQVAYLMRSVCDIFVLPSNGETFGCVVLEAIASGKPVVVTKCGGPEEIIVNQFLGELCSINDVDSLTNSILKVISQLSCYDKKDISNYALENFSYKSIATRVNEVYQSV